MHFVFNCHPSEVFLSICINCQGWCFSSICYAVNDIKYSKSSVHCFWMTRHLWDRISVGVESCRYTDQDSTGHCRLGKQSCRHSGIRWCWMKVTVGHNYVGCNQLWILVWSFASQDCIVYGWGPCSGDLQLRWALEMVHLLGPWETGLIQAVGFSLWKLVTATVSDWHH